MHVSSLRFLESSVKVVRHKKGVFVCGWLWKRTGHRVSVGLPRTTCQFLNRMYLLGVRFVCPGTLVSRWFSP